jgi:signal transduction histidine kinase
MRRLSLRSRLVALSLGASALVFAAALVLAQALTRRELEHELDARLVAVASAVAATLPADRLGMLSSGDEASRTYGHLQQRLLSMQVATHAERILVVDPQRHLLCTTAADGRVGELVPELERDRLELSGVLAGNAQASSVLFEKAKTLYKSGYAPVFDDAHHAIAIVAVDGSASFFESLHALRLELVALGLAGAVLLGLLFFGIGSAFTSPVFELVRVARAIGSGDLETPVFLGRNDELGTLAKSFERMRTALLARDRQLQMMLAGVAHEVRNPLGGMELYAGLLADDLRDRPEQLAQVTKIRRELDYLKTLVDDFLDYARNKPLQREPLQLNALLVEVSELAQPFLEPRHLSLRVKQPESAASHPISFSGDAAALRRVLLNLLKNAAEASPEKGTIRLELELELETGAERCVVSVIDEGPGIPAEQRERIFEPFFTTKEKGTGLGLAFALKLAELHGGTLELSPNPGGAHFRLMLPLLSSQEKLPGSDRTNV